MELANFRDIGGITTRLGKIKEKHLLRSGELFQLSATDISSLKNDYNLKLILDLRSLNEVVKHPDTEITGARYLNLDVLSNLSGDNTGFDSLLKQLDVNIVDKHMKDVYRDIIIDTTASRGYNQFMNEIANLANGSVIFHCFAGKDRTGLGAALLLETLGATRDDIIADYLMTNTMRMPVNQALCEEAAKTYNLSASQVVALEQFLLVKEIYLDETYNTIDERYGSVENYMLKGLGLIPETLEKLRMRYLA